MYVLFFILNEVCVCTYVYIFYEIRLCHAEERCDLSNLAHIYLFYSFTDVEFTRGHSEMLLLPVPFELCMCPEKYFFRLMGGGGGEHTGYV